MRDGSAEHGCTVDTVETDHEAGFLSMPTPVGADKNLSLGTLNQLVVQQEDQLGPLIAIGNDGAQTVLTFDMDQDPPAKHAVIGAAGSPPPPGSTTVCQGKVFIAGQLTDAVATRPN